MAEHKKHAFRINSRRAAIVVYDWISAIVLALIAILIMLTYVMRIVGVDGESMMPSLKDGDRLVLTYNSEPYDVGDIIVIDRYGEEPLIKRIIAVGDSTIEIVDTNVIVNGVQQSEWYIQGITRPHNSITKWEVPDGYVFVMGDNRSDSHDSRDEDIGLISEKDIVGRARWCVWPPSSFGSIYD